ncbi:hypothetical protein V1511DRAFT_529256 [Dipodascopsis uninucleata]
MSNPLSYPRSQGPFNTDLFKNPTAEYRGMPFWAWNTALDVDILLRQIDYFDQMGMGGFHMHVRCGLDTKYLGVEFLAAVESCINKAKKMNMYACLYDEDRWPSGAAGGMVSKDYPQYRCKHLLFTRYPYGTHPTGSFHRTDNGTLLARYLVEVNDDGKLQSFVRLDDDYPGNLTNGKIWYAYLESAVPSDPYNGGTYADNLNPEAVRRFIDITHEVYNEKFSSEFGKSVPSIFTDEPRSYHNSRFYNAFTDEDISIAWTTDWEKLFSSRYGYDILDKLPEVFWDLADKLAPNSSRYHLYDFACEQLVVSYVDQIAKWCNDHNLLLLGHMEGEAYLYDQSKKTGGECMRCYRNMGLPGIDMLCDNLEINTVKQAQSVSRQRGLKGVMCEIYGVTGYTFSFDGYKGQGDWQSALGVTLRVPHLTWITMAGDAKRDYPPCIGYQSCWYKEFKIIEDHLSRVTYAMTLGRPVCRVAVIHPIESYWMTRGPMNTSNYEQDLLENSFMDLSKWLVLANIDFDYVSESLLPEMSPLADSSSSKFTVGHCDYDVVILPCLRTIRSTTLSHLQKFMARGGRVIVAGRYPEFTDASRSIPDLQNAEFLSFTREIILNALEEHRDVKVINKSSILDNPEGSLATGVMYQLRVDEDMQYLFLCNTDRETQRDAQIIIKGLWTPTILNTFTAQEEPINRQYRAGNTVIDHYFHATGSILLKLAPGMQSSEIQEVSSKLENFKTYSTVQLRDVQLSEPNVLILDYARFKMSGDKEFEPQEEVLRIDNITRQRFGLPVKDKTSRQPWTFTPEMRESLGVLILLFDFKTEIDVTDALLAIENSNSVTLQLDGFVVSSEKSGWWVDEEIHTVKLPYISTGHHTLEVRYDYNPLTSLERLYILGSFGVSCRGKESEIVKPYSDGLQFGDVRFQLLPFYVGNIIYNVEFEIDREAKYALFIPEFASPVLRVSIDDVDMGIVAFDPRMIELNNLVIGKHKASITCYGHRNNSFGAIHLRKGMTQYFGPRAFRTEHDWWSDEYNLEPLGVLLTPRILIEGKEKYTVSRLGLERRRPVQ